MEVIRAWLNGPKLFEEGVKLYLEYGKNQTLKSVLATEGYSAFKEEKLIKALQQLLEPVIQVEQSLPKGTSVYSRHYGWPPQPIEDPVLLALHEQWKPIYQEMMHSQSRAYEVALIASRNRDNAKKMEACSLVHRIIDLDDRIDEIYGKRDYYLKNHRLPDETTPPVIGDPVRWATELKNAERYVREYRIKVKSDPGNVKWASKLEHFKSQVAHYKKLLKLDDEATG
jgi:hypothetical protein